MERYLQTLRILVNFRIIVLFLCIFVNCYLAFQYIQKQYQDRQQLTQASGIYLGDKRGLTTCYTAYYAQMGNINKKLVEG